MSVSWEELKEGLKEIIREERAKDQQPQEAHSDHVCSCPDCLCDTMKKLQQKSTWACKNCGFPLGDDAMMKKLPSCPNCGQTKPVSVKLSADGKHWERTYLEK